MLSGKVKPALPYQSLSLILGPVAERAQTETSFSKCHNYSIVPYTTTRDSLPSVLTYTMNKSSRSLCDQPVQGQCLCTTQANSWPYACLPWLWERANPIFQISTCSWQKNILGWWKHTWTLLVKRTSGAPITVYSMWMVTPKTEQGPVDPETTAQSRLLHTFHTFMKKALLQPSDHLHKTSQSGSALILPRPY